MLDFVGGVARTTVTANLLMQEIDGSVMMTVMSGSVGDNATVALVAAPEALAALTIDAPASVDQSAVAAELVIVVVVTATGTQGNAFDLTGLSLEVTVGDNTTLRVTSYALDFVGGVARTTVIASLLTQGQDGSVLLSVASGSIGDSATVALIAAAVVEPQVLAALTIDAPASVDQSAVAAELEIVVTVTATNSQGNAFDPTGLSLEVTVGANTTLTDVSYALDFVGGVARTTVTANLLTQGQDGSVLLTVASGRIGDSATVALIAAAVVEPQVLAALTIDAPASVDQSAVAAELEIVVTVTATDTLGNTIDLTGLSLEVTAGNNTTLRVTSYALDFAGGVARTTVTANLLMQEIDGSVMLTVAVGSVGDNATVALVAAPEALAALTIDAPASVDQSAVGEALEIVVTVTATGSLGSSFNPTGLSLEVTAGANTALNAVSYMLDFVGGMARTTVIASLLTQEIDGSVMLTVAVGSVGNNATVALVAAAEALAALTIDAPASVDQSAVGEALEIVVTVTATNSQGNAFDPTGLSLEVTVGANTTLTDVSYALDFVGGVARTTVTANLLTQGQDGSVLLTVASGRIGDSATVALIAAAVVEPQVLAALTIDAPASVDQSAVAAELEIVVTVTATDTLGNTIDLTGLSLEVTAGNNTTLRVTSYALDFAGGVARTTVTANLLMQEIDGSVMLTVAVGSVGDNATVALVAAAEALAALTIDAPDSVDQSAVNAELVIAVVVTATGSLGNTFDPTGLSLEVTAGANTTLTDVRYALDFAGGMARTTVTANLLTQGENGSVLLTVAGNGVMAAMTVSLQAVELLGSLTIEPPERVLQGMIGDDLTVAVRVMAMGTQGSSFNPTGLNLEATAGVNTTLSAVSYALNFAGGVAQTMVIASLLTQGQDGSVVLTVASGSIGDTATAALVAVPETLAALTIDAPASVDQSAVAAELEIVVIVTATGTLGNAFDPTDLRLEAVTTINTTPTRSFYALNFVGGTARTTVTVGLLRQGVDGVVLLSVNYGVGVETQFVSLNSVEVLASLDISAPLTVAQSAPGEALEIVVMVTANSAMNNAFNPEGLTLEVAADSNTTLMSSSYALNFAGGLAQTRVMANLLTQGQDGSVQLSVASGGIESTATTALVAVPEALAELIIDAPDSVDQSAVDAELTFAVTVTARSNLGLLFDVETLSLEVTAGSNTTLTDVSYALNFANGVAQTMVMANLLTQGQDGSVLLSVASGGIESSATAALIAHTGALAELTIDAPDSVVQSAVNAPLAFAVTVTARSDLGLLFDVENLNLELTAGNNTTLSVTRYALNFLAGVAQTTVTADLLTQGEDGSVMLTVMSDGVAAMTTVSLVAVPEALERLIINVPTVVTQTVTGSELIVAASVEARSNYDRLIDPGTLRLQLQVGANTTAAQSSYELNFTGGVGRATLVLSLIEQGLNGSVELSVVGDGVEAAASVSLQAVEILSSLLIIAPETVPVMQTATASTVNFVVAVRAQGSLNSPFDPGVLKLRLTVDSNIEVVQSSYDLTFSDEGRAEVAVQVKLRAGADVGSLTLSVKSGAIEDSAAVLLTRTPESLATLIISAPDQLLLTAANEDQIFTVRVLAMSNYLRPFDPDGLNLEVTAGSNTSPTSRSYPLSFAGGSAQTLVTASLLTLAQSTDSVLICPCTFSPAEVGSVQLSVASAGIETSDTVALLASVFVEVLAGLSIDTPASVAQSAPGEVLQTTVTVRATDIFGNVYDPPPGVNLEVTAGANTALTVSTYPLIFAGGMAQTTVTANLLRQGFDGSVQLSVARGGTADRVTVTLEAVELLASLIISAPVSVSQAATDEALEIVVTVTATGTQGNAFDPTDLSLAVTAGANTTLSAVSYALNFVGGVAQTTVIANLLTQGFAGSVQMSVARGGIEERVAVALQAVEVLGSLAVSAPAAVFQGATGEALEIAVTVTATGTQGSVFNPTGLNLEVTAGVNTTLSAVSYALDFVDGVARTTVIASLLTQEIDGSVMLTVAVGSVGDNATVALIAAAEALAALTIDAPASVDQSAVAAELVIVVVVTATGTQGNAFDPTGLSLEVTVGTNTTLTDVRYALDFVDGMVRTTVTANLLTQGENGSVLLTVAGNGVMAAMTVSLQAVELLGSLTIEPPERVLQAMIGDDLTISVRVMAMGTQGSSFNPTGLNLEATAGANTTLSAVSYALNFAGGVAQTMVIASLLTQGQDGSVVLTVASGSIGDTATAALVAVPETLAALTIDAPASVDQSAVAAELEIVVIVTATGTLGNPIDPTGLRLEEVTTLNTTPTRSFYALNFVGGTARTTVTVGLLRQGVDGVVLLSVNYGAGVETQFVSLNAVEVLASLAISAPLTVAQSAPGEALEIMVMVTANSAMNNAFNPEGLTLEATVGSNTTLTSSSYALNFAGGLAQTTVMANLLTQGQDGSVLLSVASGGIESTATTALVAVPEALAELIINVPDSVDQSAVDAELTLAVTVTARSNLGLLFDVEALTLEAAAGGNTTLTSSSYTLNFVAGVAQTTVTASLLTQGQDGSVLLSVVSGGIESTATATLVADPGILVELTIDAPASVDQSAVNAQLAFAVTVTARSDLEQLFDVEDLNLEVTAGVNTTLTDVSYALNFAGGVAQTTVTADLLTQGEDGSVMLTVMSDGVAAMTTVSLVAVPEALERLIINVPTVVTQTVTGSELIVAASVEARSNYDRLIDPGTLRLQLQVGANTTAAQSSYELNFTGGVGRATLVLSLIEQGLNGSVELSVVGDGVEAAASVSLQAVEILSSLLIIAPETVPVMQTATASTVNFVVAVRAQGSLNSPFDPGVLKLRLTVDSNIEVVQSSYDLTFSDEGRAEVAVQVKLRAGADVGSLTLSVKSGAIEDSAAVLLTRTPESLATLIISAPDQLLLTAANEDQIFTVRVLARSNYLRPFDPDGLSLEATAATNTTLNAVSYALSFSGGAAQTTVAASLLTLAQSTDSVLVCPCTFSPAEVGSVQLSVASAGIETSDTVALLASVFVEVLAGLSIDTPDSVAQSAPGEVLQTVVTVRATDIFGNVYDPQGVNLEVTAGDNTALPVSSYPLDFAGGMAQTTVTVELLRQGFDGSVQLSVARGGTEDRVTVALRAVELLASLAVSAPVSVFQAETGEALEIVVVVTATNTQGNAFDPTGLSLEVTAGANTTLSAVSYALDFVGGMAQTTVTVELLTQGFDGSVQMSVASGGIEERVTVALQALEVLGSLVVSAPAAVSQAATGEALEIAVTVTATGTQGSSFNPTELSLEVTAGANTTLRVTSYALNFAGGVARTTVTANLLRQGENGSVVLTVAGDGVMGALMVSLQAVELLRSLTIETPDRVLQDLIGADLMVVLRVLAVGTQDNMIDPMGLSLAVTAGANTTLNAVSYELDFSGGMAQVTVLASLLTPGEDGSVVLTVASGSIGDTATVALIAVPEVLEQLTLNVPTVATQTVTGSDLIFAASVEARSNYERAIDPGELQLQLQVGANTTATQSGYPLNFAGGIAQTTVTLRLIDQGVNGSVLLSVAGDGVIVEMAVSLRAIELLRSLTIDAPDRVLQNAVGEDLTVAVQVLAENLQGNAFDPQGLILEVMAGANTGLMESTYRLSFVSGVADVVVTARLTTQQINGSLILSVSSGDIESTAAVELRAVQTVVALEINAPEQVLQLQGRTGQPLSFAVVVSALNTLGNPYTYADLELEVIDLGNVQVEQSTYSLTFVNGQAQVTVAVKLTVEGTDGRVLLQVVSDDSSASATVALTAVPESLAALNIVAPAAVDQLAAGEALEIVVAVTATGTLGNAFDPTGLSLEVTAGANTTLRVTSYVLNFAGGVAQTTVTVSLVEQGFDGGVLLSVASAGAQASAAVSLQAVEVLGSLGISAPVLMTQSAPGEALEIVVAITATGTQGNAFDPAGVVLQVSAVGNAQRTQSTYSLSFAGGVAMTTVTVSLVEQGFDGSVLLSVTSNGAQASATVSLQAVEVLGSLGISAPISVPQPVPGAVLEIAVVVTATGTKGNAFDPAGVVLQVSAVGNAQLTQSTYSLSFAGGVAMVTVTVSLVEQGFDGSVLLSVTSAGAQARAAVSLRAVELLGSLTIDAPARVLQSASGADLTVAVRVLAEGTLGNAFDPGALILEVMAGSNTVLEQSTYPLSFASGVADVVVTASLVPQQINGSLMLSVRSGDIEATGAVELRAVQTVAAFGIEAPEQVQQGGTGDNLSFAVTVSATNTLGNPYAYADLELQVTDSGNAQVDQSTYILSFVNGQAQVIVTVGLAEQGFNGSVLLTVDSDGVMATMTVSLQAVALLASLEIDAPARVTQNAIGADLTFLVRVGAVGSLGFAFNPEDFVLEVIAGTNTVLVQSTYPLSFASGIGTVAVTAALAMQLVDGNLLLLARSGDIEETWAVTLVAAPENLGSMNIVAPAAVDQLATGEALEIAVVVTATGTQGDAFDPEGLVLRVLAVNNSTFSTSSYELNFADGVAQATVTVNLVEQGFNGIVQLSAVRNGVVATAIVALQSVELLASLAIETPARILQNAFGEDFTVSVPVRAVGTQGSAFNPDGLVLEVMAGANTGLEQSTYSLSFASGVADVVVTARLTTQQVNGSLLLSVRSGDIDATAAVELRAVQTVAALEIEAPQQVQQGSTGDSLSFAVTVSATNTLGNPYAYADLELQVTGLVNALAEQSTYLLVFVNGQAQATVVVNLTEEGENGSVLLQVVSGDSSARATVALTAAAESLAALMIEAPARILQNAVGEDFTVAATVRAVGTLNNAFNPAGLVLQVVAGANTVPAQSTYPLSFVSGVAETTVTAALTLQQVNGSLLLSVRSGDIEATGEIELRAVQAVAALEIEAPQQVQQGRTGDSLSFAVTVSATNTQGNPYAYADLQLEVSNLDNAQVDQSPYLLVFANGQAQATVVVNLTTEGEDGSVLLQVVSGDSSARATVALTAAAESLAALNIVAPAAVDQSVTGEVLEIAVVVTATGTLGNAFDPEVLVLRVLAVSNSTLATSSYELNFAGGTAQVTVTVSLLEQGFNGIVQLSAVRDGAVATAIVSLRAVELLASLAIEAPARVLQSAMGDDFTVAAAVRAVGTLNSAFNPDGLILQVIAGANTGLAQSTYVLSFVSGVAETTVTASLLMQQVNGSLQLSVRSGNIEDAAAIELRAVQAVAALEIEAPQQVQQGRTGDSLSFAVTVSATNTLGNPYAYTDLQLEVTNFGNAQVDQSTYMLVFVNGQAQATVAVNLTTEGEDGSVLLQVVSGDSSARATVALTAAAESLAALNIEAPARILQNAVGDDLTTAVQVRAVGTLNNVFNPEGLVLQVMAGVNTVPVQSSYALSFTSGVAEVTVTASLALQQVNGSLQLSVRSDNIEDAAAIELRAVQTVAALEIEAPEQVQQGRTGDSLSFAVVVSATNTLGNPYAYADLQLQVTNIDNAQVDQSPYVLSFANGQAQATVVVNLTIEGDDGSVLLQVVSGDSSARATVALTAAVENLALLNIVAPAAVDQSATGEVLEIAVVVTATGTLGSAFNPEGLLLRVLMVSNSTLATSSYELNFVDGTAMVTATVSLVEQGFNGIVQLSTVGDGAVATAIVSLRAVELLASLAIEAPARILQSAVGDDFTVSVPVRAVGTLGNMFDPEGLVLQVMAGANTVPAESSYALSFVSGVAEATVTASLLMQQLNGSLQLSVSSGDIESTATVELRAVQTVAALEIEAPEQVQQGRTGDSLSFAVTVSATNTLGNPYAYADLELQVTNLGNAQLDQSRYALVFVNGQAQATVVVNLTIEGDDGSVLLQVVSGDSSARATVALTAAAESLALLNIAAPAAVDQSTTGEVLEIAVVVTATGTLGNAFDPEGLVLEVMAGANTVPAQSTYLLSFAAGVAETTVTVALALQQVNGSLQLSVRSGDIEATAAIELRAVQTVAALAIEAPGQVQQGMAGDSLSFAVTVSATNTLGNPYAYTALELQVTDLGNAQLDQSTYILNFVEGVAQTTVTVSLVEQGFDGSVLLSVVSDGAVTSAVVSLRAAELLSSLTFVVPDQLAVQVPDEAVLLPVVVLAVGAQGGAVNPEGIYLEIIAADNTTLTMARRLLSFVNGQAQAEVSVELLNQLQSGLIELQLSEVPAGVVSQSVQVRILPASIASIELDLSDSELIQTTIGEVLQTTLTITVTGFFPTVFPLSGLELQYSSESPLSSIEFSPQQLFFTTPTTGLASSLSVAVRIVPAQAQNTTLLLTVGNIPATIDLTAEVVPLRITAVPRRLAFISLTATESTLRQLAAGQPVTATLTVVSLDNYGQPFRLAAVALDITATNRAIVGTPQFRVIEDGMLELQLQVTLVDLVDTRVTLRITEEGLQGAVEILPTGGVSILVQRPAAVLSRVVLERVTPDTALIQSDPRLPVQFEVSVRGLDQFGSAIGYTMLELSIAGSTADVQILREPEIFTADANGSLVTVFVLPAQNTTLTVAVTGLPEGVVSNQLLLQVQAATGPLTPTIDLTGDNRVTMIDIIIALRWLDSGKPDRLSDELLINLPITAEQISPERFANLQMLFMVQRAGENADVNSDGVADQFDLRLILRYLSGLRGAFLNDPGTVNRILLLLGQYQDINLPSAPASLNRVTVELISPEAALIQNDPRLPVQFQLSVRGLDQYGGAMGYTLLGLSIAGTTTDTLIVWQPEILTADLGGSLVTVFVLPLQNTTLTVAVTGLPEGVVSNQLLLQVQADTGPLTPTLDLTGDDLVTESEIILALNWLNAGQPDMLGDDLFVNLPITAAQITTAGFISLQMLFTVQRAGENADVNGDGSADQADLDLILRYLSDLEESLVGDTATVNRILLLLGRDQELNLPAALIRQ